MFIFEDHSKLVYTISDLLFRSDHATYTLSRDALSTSVGYRKAWSLKLFHLYWLVSYILKRASVAERYRVPVERAESRLQSVNCQDSLQWLCQSPFARQGLPASGWSAVCLPAAPPSRYQTLWRFISERFHCYLRLNVGVMPLVFTVKGLKGKMMCVIGVNWILCLGVK